MDLPENSFDQSLLVAAYPGDEALWFSSILDDVAKIVIIFADLAQDERPTGHPCRDKIVSLGLAPLACDDLASWPLPQETEYGLRLDKNPELDERYAEQAARITDALDPILSDAHNIFTHNPWGEYGRENHVQVSRVVTTLAASVGATVWYSNYVSGKSSRLLRRYVHGFSSEYFTRSVDKTRAGMIEALYRESSAPAVDHGSARFPSECFVRGPLKPATSPAVGTVFPVNYVRVPFEPVAPRRSRPDFVMRLRRKLGRLIGLDKPVTDNASTA